MRSDPKNTKTFKTEAAFEKWMRTHHARETEVWLRIYKKSSGVATITPAQALDVALCWGWIDAIRNALDEQSFLQRYTPRRPKSVWSQINRDHVARLTKAGKMTPQGQKQIDAAKADGRWEAAYEGQRTAQVPPDLRRELDGNPTAAEFFASLDSANRYAIVYRLDEAKRPETRERRLKKFVAMLARGEKIHG